MKKVQSPPSGQRLIVTDFHEAIRFFQWKKQGSYLVGPCPICGGHDRFSLKETDNSAWPYCRKGCKQGELIRSLRHQGLLADSKSQSFSTVRLKNKDTNSITLTAVQRIQRAQAIWANGTPFNGYHGYLQRKRLTLQHPENFRLVQSHQISRDVKGLDGSCIVFPLSCDGEIRAVQLIDENGKKRTLGKPKGAAFRYGIPIPDNPILIGEGLATVASVANGLFGCGYVTVGDWNIDPVIRKIKCLHRGENDGEPEFIILGDIDKNECINQKALKAAATHGIKITEASHV